MAKMEYVSVRHRYREDRACGTRPAGARITNRIAEVLIWITCHNDRARYIGSQRRDTRERGAVQSRRGDAADYQLQRVAGMKLYDGSTLPSFRQPAALARPPIERADH